MEKEYKANSQKQSQTLSQIEDVRDQLNVVKAENTELKKQEEIMLNKPRFYQKKPRWL